MTRPTTLVAAAFAAAALAAGPVALAAAAPPAQATAPITPTATATSSDARIAPAKVSKPRVVASGLDNPRLLAFSPSGALYVAEAGRGGPGPCVEGPEGRACLGATGALTRIVRGTQQRVLTGLPSTAGSGGASATGPADVLVDRRGRYTVLVGLGNDPARRAAYGSAGARLGTVLTGTLGRGGPRPVADLAAYEARANPDGGDPAKGGVDTNPTAIAASRTGLLVADAGGNSLLRVRGSRVGTLAVFPAREVLAPPFLKLPPGTKIPMQSVPTSVAIGPDGAAYVSELTGFPFGVGEARIWRVRPAQRPTVYADGLTNLTDLAFHGRHLYAVQLADGGLTAVPEGTRPRGSLVRIRPGQGKHVTVADGLDAPYGLALRRGKAYVTTCTVCAGDGKVVEIGLR